MLETYKNGISLAFWHTKIHNLMKNTLFDVVDSCHHFEQHSLYLKTIFNLPARSDSLFDILALLPNKTSNNRNWTSKTDKETKR